MSDDRDTQVERRLVDVSGGALEVFIAPARSSGPSVCAAHPAGVFTEGAAKLIREMAEVGAVCVNVRGIGQSSAVPPGGARYDLESMVDDLDVVRQRLGLDAWVFWGMSGGGWLGLEYAFRHPRALRGLIVESACPCFRLRLADPACILSPFHPSWRAALDKLGLISPDSHAAIGDRDATEWIDVNGVGSVFRRCNGSALLVSPMPVAPEMRAAAPLLWTIDLRESLPAIRTPTLVIGGSADPIVPLSHVQSLHDGVAGSSLLIVEGGGHVPTTMRSKEVADTARTFLRGCAAS